MEPRLRATSEQFSVLIEFMERHGDLAKPLAGVAGRVRTDCLWRQLAKLLNSVNGGVKKHRDKWKKVWADWKTKTKKKYYTMIQRQMTGTGGGPNNRQVVTTTEKRLMTLLGLSTAAISEARIPEQDFSRPNEETISEESNEVRIEWEVPHTNDVPDIREPAEMPNIPEWAREIEERHLVAQERTAQALEGLLQAATAVIDIQRQILNVLKERLPVDM